MTRDWRAAGHQKPGRKVGTPHGPYRMRDREGSREKTELMVHLRVEERLSLGEIGEIFGCSREAVRLRLAQAGVRGCLDRERVVPPLTPGRFARLVRKWVEESGAWYCSRGRHVVTERRGQMCRECNRVRQSEYQERVNPKVQRRSPAQVARIRRARWGY